jgi:hypothetical protein
MYKKGGAQVRIFMNKIFHCWAKEVGISDNELKKAIIEISNGLYEANLGGNVYKKRVAIGNRGKRAGTRTLVAFIADKHTFFIYGYEKNVRSNITNKEEIALKKLAKIYFSFSDEQLAKAVHVGELVEVK